MHLGMLKSLLGKDGVPGSSGVLGPPACVSPLRAACGGISDFSCSGQGGQSGGLPPACGVCHSSSAPGVAHTPVWRSHTKEDGAEVGAAAHREGGAAGVVQEDRGILPGLRGGSAVSLGAVALPAQTPRPQTEHHRPRSRAFSPAPSASCAGWGLPVAYACGGEPPSGLESSFLCKTPAGGRPSHHRPGL